MKSRHLILELSLMMILLTLASTNALAEGKINLKALYAKQVPILLEFGRGWCIPCKYMKPILEEMGAAYQGKAIVTTVDMDANKDLVRSFGIRMMPTQVFLAPDGKEFFRHEGVLERNQIAYVFSKMGLPEIAPGARPAQVPQSVAPQPFPAIQGARR
jgi:thioredoxin 1